MGNGGVNCDDDIIDLTKSRLHPESGGTSTSPQEGEGLFSSSSDMASTAPSWSLLANLLTQEPSSSTCDKSSVSAPQGPPPPSSLQEPHHGSAPLGGVASSDKWAVPVPRTLIVELDQEDQMCSSQRIVVEEIEDTPGDEERVGVMEPDGYDVALIQEATAAINACSSKPERLLSKEEKIWRLAKTAGSTLPEDHLELDADAKRKVKERLKSAGLTDKVSLAF